MSTAAIITIGLTLVVLSSAGIVACFVWEKRRERREKRHARLACLKDPVCVRTILSR